ncbi:MAG: hypothetical protein HQL19_05520 [Candidatus Omnitrophica bacterium]|nr:hypothetical protein [Candidatus Omnitrophota bacterium]
MTLDQKKIAAFGGFFILFVLQVLFSVSALQSLHASHRVIEQEWKEYIRVQALEDLLDEQSAVLMDAPTGVPSMSGAGLEEIFVRTAKIGEELAAEYELRRRAQRGGYEDAQDGHLRRIIEPLRAFLKEYRHVTGTGRLVASEAGEYAKKIADIRREVILLGQADAAVAQKALDQAQHARRNTLQDSLIISAALFVILVLWAGYFLINLNRQTRNEISRQKLMTAGLLAQSLAHEIRNPLGVIKSAADLLAHRSSLDPESRELAGYMVDEVTRIDGQITGLLSLSHPKSAPREPSDIGRIIHSVLDLIAGKMKSTGVTAVFVNNAEGALCRCAPDQMRQVILNLLLNALDVSPANGVIDITAGQKDGFYVMTFQDRGKGFSMRDKEKIFDLFYTTKESGFGIGLAVVKRIVSEHRGRVEVHSAPGQGAIFSIYLPMA